MDVSLKNFLQRSQRRQPQIYDVVFEMEYFLNLKLKVTCGFSTAFGFKPMIWLHYKDKQFIGFGREEWLHLMSYKDYISSTLSQREFLNSINLIENTSEEDTEYSFKYKNGVCYLIIQQEKYKIKIDPETWKSLIGIGIFLTSILCWNGILRKQLLHFYYNYYIPTCSTLKKTEILLSDISGINERDIEIDLTRLCYEIGKKMQNKIITDVKIHRLYLRMDNK